MTILLLFLCLAAALGLLYAGKAYLAWVVPGAVWLGWLVVDGILPLLIGIPLGALFIALAVLFGVRHLRMQVLTLRILPLVAKMLPRMGETEKIALDAGTVWWDGELFSGAPRWSGLINFRSKGLSDKEKAFLQGPVSQLCAMLDEWQIEERRDLPPEVWTFIKQNKFFGMIIPEQYGGLGFSALAHSQTVVKVSSRSVTAAVTIMVPNSLGPAELLLHYGTDAQKNYYLPRLARGEEIPCFALTGPEAGSDAAATQSVGVVCRGQWHGREVLGMRLAFRKRYITLAPVSTLIGLAFRLKDPDGLLGKTEDLGITCALVPSNLPGIEIGKRHDPMGIPFHNGPIVGKDVFVPLDAIIGGPDKAGQGWRMLMETLAVGRSISLPALSLGAAQLATRVVGAYATVREQFDTPIGRFEGIEEPLARIGGMTYLMDAARKLTVAGVDAGERPAVLSAIAKAYLTEGMRQVVNDAMDVRAGSAICRGPRNMLARAYMASPIGITVEGANILTRSMIIYGQGAIRCHPFVRREMTAAVEGDVPDFDEAFFGHLGFVARNVARSFLLALTGGSLAKPALDSPLADYLGDFSRLAAAFALCSDVAMGTLGGSLKRREKISGRLADALAWIYLGAAAIKRYHDDRRTHMLPLARWSCEKARHEVQQALLGVFQNLPMRPAAWFLRAAIFPLGARFKPPSDALGQQVARALLEDRPGREHLTGDMYVPPPTEAGLGKLEAALDAHEAVVPIETKLRDAIRAGKLDRAPGPALADLALQHDIITAEEREKLRAAHAAVDDVIQVDAFDWGRQPARVAASAPAVGGAAPSRPGALPVPAARGPTAASPLVAPAPPAAPPPPKPPSLSDLPPLPDPID